MAAVPSIGRANRVEGGTPPEADLTRALYEQHANAIFRYCLHQLGSREEAEDAVQSTFLNAFRGIKRGIVPELESAWLFKIAHNVCLSRRRSSWRRGRVESPADFELVEEIAPAPSRRSDELIGLQDVLEQMPEMQRRAILLREWQGLSYREIGEELELSQSAVETLIFRARRALASGLEQPPAQRKRSIARAADWGNVVAALQSMAVGGSATAKIAATVAVVSAATVVAAAPMPQRRTHHEDAGAPTRAVPQAIQTSSASAGPSASGAPAMPFTSVIRHPRTHLVRHRAAIALLSKPAPAPPANERGTGSGSVESAPAVHQPEITPHAEPVAVTPSPAPVQGRAAPARSAPPVSDKPKADAHGNGNGNGHGNGNRHENGKGRGSGHGPSTGPVQPEPSQPVVETEPTGDTPGKGNSWRKHGNDAQPLPPTPVQPSPVTATTGAPTTATIEPTPVPPSAQAPASVSLTPSTSQPTLDGGSVAQR